MAQTFVDTVAFPHLDLQQVVNQVSSWEHNNSEIVY